MFHAPYTLAAATILMAATAIAGPVGYVINFSGQFGTMDLSTGVFTPVGPGTENVPDGIAGLACGPFFTIDGSNGHLLRILASGEVTDVGDTGTGPQVAPAGISLLGGLADGSLYALDFSNRLYAVDHTNGSLLLQAALPLPTQEDDYSGNMTTSLNGDATFLYYTVEISEGPNMTGPTLFRIDPVNMIVTSVPLTNLTSRIIGSGFVGGMYFAFTEFGEIVNINLETGVANQVGQYESGSTADNPGPPLTGVFGVVSREQ